MQINWDDRIEQNGNKYERYCPEVDFIVLFVADKCNETSGKEYDYTHEGIVTDR
jgi:hypothetical protein